MSAFKEWQHLPQTKSFVQDLKKIIEGLKNDSVVPTALTIEQIAIRNIEISSEVRTYEQIIEIITKEQEDE